MTRPVLTPLDGVAIIGTAELEDNAVTNAKMADNAVNTAELVNGAVTLAKINGAAYSPLDGANTLVQRTSDGRFDVATPTSNKNAVNKEYIDGASGWTLFSTYASGWSFPSFDSSEFLIFKKVGANQVNLVGGSHRSGGSALLGTLPVGYRPVSVMRVLVVQFDSSSETVSTARIAPTGDITIGSAPGNDYIFNCLLRIA